MIDIPRVRCCSYIGDGSIDGHLQINNDMFSFLSDDGNQSINTYYINIGNLISSKMAQSTAIIVTCKNYANLTLFSEDDRVFCELSKHFKAQIKTNRSQLSAFIYPLIYKMTVPKSYGWNIYDKREDFSRMCGYQNNNFIESTINSNYEVCPTYPNIVFVPKGSEAQMTLIGSSKFRSKCRFPVLSYFYNANNTCIIRCAQPLSGIGNKSMEDIQLLKLFWQLKEPFKKLHIYDARPKINAMANKAQGKGFEDLRDYHFCCFEFLDIPNIHVVRDSLTKYLDAVRSKHDSVSSLWQTINSSNWPSYIELIIQAAIKISSSLHYDGVNSLIHCSDGWDRTAQLCALSSLLLDPFYRTITGFIVLIEKEFISFGHKFCERNGLINSKSKEVSPIFTQFLDCIFQLIHKYPSTFQFNERFLFIISQHLFSCQFGTFLADSEYDRIKNKISDKTDSLWNYILSDINSYVNFLYEPRDNTFLPCAYNSLDFKIWKNLYCANIPKILDSQCFDSILSSINEMKQRDSIYKSRDMKLLSNSWESIANQSTCACNRSICYPTDSILHCSSCCTIFCKTCLTECDGIRYCSACLKISSITYSVQNIQL